MIGRVVKGKYKIYDEVGSGGFATVYLGRNMDTNEIVAIKVLSSQFTREERYVERFRREAGLAERLQHPNIVRILDHGIEDGVHFLVMEFVEGLTLDTLMERKGRLSIEETISYTEQVCAGLQAACEAGVVHRDIKPANVMITPGGTVKIMDFGIARMEAMAGLTQSGTFMGTPRYISPEMARGAKADTRADLYALGLVVYEMLTGTAPFDAENPWAVLRQQIEADPAPIHQVRPEVPPWLEAVTFKALAKDPALRFQTPAEMLAGLKERTATPSQVYAAAAVSAATADATQITGAQPRQGLSRSLVIGLIAAAVVVALGLVALLGFVLGGRDEATPTATQAAALPPTDAPTKLPTNTSVIVVITNTPRDTDTPEPTPTNTATPAPTETPTETSTPEPTETPTPEPSETPTPAPTAVPPTRGPTNTPAPTATPTSPPAPAVAGRIAYSSGGTLHIVDAATGQDRVAPIAGMVQPDFRADGQLILANGEGGQKTSMWTIDANTGAFIREQSSFTNDFRPFWSPDGTQFAYDSLHQGKGDYNVYKNVLDSNFDEVLIAGSTAIIGTSPVWMQDDWIAFTGCNYWLPANRGGGSKCGIYRMPSWGGQPAQIREGSLTLRATDNHGSQLLIMTQESGDWEVYIMPNQGGSPLNLSNSPSSNDGLGTFSPDGKLVAFVSNRGGGWAIWVVRVNGTGLTKLFDLPGPPSGNWTEDHISWAP